MFLASWIHTITTSFLSFLGSGMRLSPLGTSATNWSIVPAPDDRWWWLWSSWWDQNWQGKLKYLEKTCPSATLSTTDLTWPDLGSNRGRRSGNMAIKRLSYGTAICIISSHFFEFTQKTRQTWIWSVAPCQPSVAVYFTFKPRITYLYDLTCTRTRASPVGSRRLTAWAMARPSQPVILK
jgi:hypothetical protein